MFTLRCTTQHNFWSGSGQHTHPGLWAEFAATPLGNGARITWASRCCSLPEHKTVVVEGGCIEALVEVLLLELQDHQSQALQAVLVALAALTDGYVTLKLALERVC